MHGSSLQTVQNVCRFGAEACHKAAGESVDRHAPPRRHPLLCARTLPAPAAHHIGQFCMLPVPCRQAQSGCATQHGSAAALEGTPGSSKRRWSAQLPVSDTVVLLAPVCPIQDCKVCMAYCYTFIDCKHSSSHCTASSSSQSWYNTTQQCQSCGGLQLAQCRLNLNCCACFAASGQHSRALISASNALSACLCSLSLPSLDNASTLDFRHVIAQITSNASEEQAHHLAQAAVAAHNAACQHEHLGSSKAAGVHWSSTLPELVIFLTRCTDVGLVSELICCMML